MRISSLLLALALAAPAAAQSPAFPVDAHTVALYTFDGTDPDTTFDVSGNGRHALNDGTTPASGRHGQARWFDGEDDRVDMDAARVALQGTVAWTLEYIARAQSGSSIPTLLLHNCRNGWRLQAAGASARYGTKTTSSGCTWNVDRFATLPDIGEAWHYVALAFGDGALSLYVDGALVSSTPSSGAFNGADDRQAWIGYSSSSDGSYFPGFADELRVSEVARTAEEICTTANDLGWPCTTTAGESDPTAGPIAFRSVVPNPFAGRATVTFELPKAGPTRLAVYDVLGREVAVLVDGERSAGWHEVVLDGRGLPSGVYSLRLSAEGYAQTQRLTLLR